MCPAGFHVLGSQFLLDILQDSNKAKILLSRCNFGSIFNYFDISNLLSIEPGHGLLRGGVASLPRPPPTLGTLSRGQNQEGGEK